MAEAPASAAIAAPAEAVREIVRDFEALPSWVPGPGPCRIEDGLAPDAVGCIRAFQLGGGTPVRERLTMLDDSRYAFVTPAFPVEDYQAAFQLIPVTNGSP